MMTVLQSVLLKLNNRCLVVVERMRVSPSSWKHLWVFDWI